MYLCIARCFSNFNSATQIISQSTFATCLLRSLVFMYSFYSVHWFWITCQMCFSVYKSHDPCFLWMLPNILHLYPFFHSTLKSLVILIFLLRPYFLISHLLFLLCSVKSLISYLNQCVLFIPVLFGLSFSNLMFLWCTDNTMVWNPGLIIVLKHKK